MQKKINPHITVDCVIFGFDFKELKMLMIQREFKNNHNEVEYRDYKFPGNFVWDDEDLDTSAARVLKELTGLENIFLKQFYTFGSPARVEKERDINWLTKVADVPIERIITVAYYSLIKLDPERLSINQKIPDANWYSLSDLKNLAFDHELILSKALKKLRREVRNEPVGFELLPEKFTLTQLQKVHEVILGRELDKRNFRKKIKKLNYVIPLNEKQAGVPHKPARMYKFNRVNYERLKENGFDFTL